MASEDCQRWKLHLLGDLQSPRPTAEIAFSLVALLSMEQFRHQWKLPACPKPSSDGTAAARFLQGGVSSNSSLTFKQLSAFEPISVFELLISSLWRVLQADRFKGGNQVALRILELGLNISSIVESPDHLVDLFWTSSLAGEHELTCTALASRILKQLEKSGTKGQKEGWWFWPKWC